jgi:UDP:flavonoid glycosyltransferase YjiC (YdhE family)
MGLGGVTRCLAVAQEAALRGHSIAFMAPRAMHRMLRDFAACLYDVPAPAPADHTAAKPFRLADSLRIRRMDDPDYLRRTVAAELAAYQNFSADVVFTENQLSCAISTAVAGLPLIATTASVNHEHFTSPLFGEHDTLRGVERGFNAVAIEYGLDPVSSVSQLLERNATLLIAPTAPELEPLLVGMPKLHFVGPLLYSRIDLGPLPHLPGDKPLVYVYMSAGDVQLDTVLDVLRRGVPGAAGVRFAVSARRHFGTAPHGVGADGISLIDLPPGVTLLGHCDAAITHGGQNTTMVCLLTGTPALIIPGRNAERDFNARGVTSRRAALHADVANLGSDRLASAVRRLLEEPDFGTAAALLGDRLRQFGGPTAVVRLIEQL